MSTYANDKLREIEAITRRQDHDDKDHMAMTGKLCGAVSRHTTNRCLEPQQHQHRIVFNAGYANDKWRDRKLCRAEILRRKIT